METTRVAIEVLLIVTNALVLALFPILLGLEVRKSYLWAKGAVDIVDGETQNSSLDGNGVHVFYSPEAQEAQEVKEPQKHTGQMAIRDVSAASPISSLAVTPLSAPIEHLQQLSQSKEEGLESSVPARPTQHGGDAAEAAKGAVKATLALEDANRKKDAALKAVADAELSTKRAQSEAANAEVRTTAV